MKNIKALIISIIISLGVGGLAGFITKNSVNIYDQLILPELAPPSFIFPIVWTVLYVLMGISAYLIYTSKSPYRKIGLKLYAIQLFLNFIWSPIFFNGQMFLLALIVLVLLLLVLLVLIKVAYKINPISAYLLVPYLLWVAFAGYLNLAIYLLNK